MPMGNIKIGKKISEKRKEKGITQEDLANYLGVSKPAVSKWESGQSYPDILLLPVMAAYFNISVDELIGYEPQMTKEDIRKLYHRIAGEFSSQPFDQVYEECMQYVKKYFSCWQLQVSIGLLLINHAPLAKEQEKINEVIKKAMQLFENVAKSSEDVILVKEAIQLQAFCYLYLNRPSEAIDLLVNIKDSLSPTETLLIKAYQMKGDKKKAARYLQGFTYANLANLINVASDYFAIYSDDPVRLQYYYKNFASIGRTFDMQDVNPAGLLNFYISAAYVFASQGNKENALDALEDFIRLTDKAKKHDFKYIGNDYFDALEEYFNEMDIDTAAPRSTPLIQKDIKSIVLDNPVFAGLYEEERFIRIKKQIEDV